MPFYGYTSTLWQIYRFGNGLKIRTGSDSVSDEYGQLLK